MVSFIHINIEQTKCRREEREEEQEQENKRRRKKERIIVAESVCGTWNAAERPTDRTDI